MLSFTPTHSFLVGIDSDGCAFDTMEVKHKDCFIPRIIEGGKGGSVVLTSSSNGVTPQPGPNYRALTGKVEVRKDGRLIETLAPEKRIYNASGQTMTIAAIDTGILGDRYVSLGEPVSADATNVDGPWGVRIYLKPFVDWIWMGAFLMALGGFIAVSDRRYRLALKTRAARVFGKAVSHVGAD